MSITKVKLKAAREALSRQDYPTARDAAQQVLEYEPNDYHAHVFLGLASLELADFVACEQAYKKAIELKPEVTLAWQGLTKFCERTERWDDCVVSLEKQAILYQFDAAKCAEAIQKLIEIRRNHGTRVQLAQALKLLLHGSPIFEALSDLPLPDHTKPSPITSMQDAIHNTLPVLQELVTLYEDEEQEVIKKEIAKRRTRLGAPSLDQLAREVKYAVLSKSELPTLYDEVAAHPNASEDVRRAAEGKLLRYRLELLESLAGSANPGLREKVWTALDESIKGVVLLGIPDEVAWGLHFQWADSQSIEGYNIALLQQYATLFSSSKLSQVFAGYLSYSKIGTSVEETQKSGEVTIDSALNTIFEGQEATNEFTIACRILAEVYSKEKDFPSAVKMAKQGMHILQQQEALYGLNLRGTVLGFYSILGTSLVGISPLRYRTKSLSLLSDVLQQMPDDIPCLLAKARVLQAIGNWEDTTVTLEHAVKCTPPESPLHLLVQEESAWSRFHVSRNITELTTLESVLSSYKSQQSDERARCSWRIAECYRTLGDDYSADAYRFYIASLKASSTFAPAFTSLGIHYLIASEPPDRARALKCFQKAFELDSRETYAAEQLATGFANEGAWSLVEVVARRTIQGNNVEVDLPGFEAEDDDPHSTLTWAWKAVGAVELTNKKYSTAITAFQKVLRSQPLDDSSWLFLGETYQKAGRFTAALNAFTRAQELAPNSWIPSYNIGLLKRQTSEYVESIVCLQSILDLRPTEFGVLVAQAQACLELGCSEFNSGIFARATTTFIEGIRAALLATTTDAAGLRGPSWKLIGDALVMLARTSIVPSPSIITPIFADLVSKLPSNSTDRLRGVYSYLGAGVISFVHTTELAVAVYSHRVSLDHSETSVSASAHFDLATSLICWLKESPGRNGAEVAKEFISTSILQALRLDPTNDLYWVTFGNHAFSDQPKVAQHAFIKALEINPKSATTWTTLGLLYLHHGDMELAGEALRKAQVLDPDYRLAWVAQALMEESSSNFARSSALIEHSLGMKLNSACSDLWYASKAYASQNASHDGSSDALLPAFFALGRYVVQNPKDAYGLHLYGLLCERLGHLTEAVSSLNRAIAILEMAYEESESQEVETQFATASGNLARIKLALSDYQGAIDAYSNALGLLSEEDNSPTTLLLRFQSSLGSALAHFKLGDLTSTMSSIETAIQSAGDDLRLRGLVNVLHSQILWKSGDEYREHAISGLLEHVAEDVENLRVMQTLVTMGILTEDESLIDAAISEIINLPLDKRQLLDPRGHINYLLIQNQLGQNNTAGAILTAQRAVKVEPTNDTMRQNMASLEVQNKSFGTALSMLAGVRDVTDNAAYSADSFTLHAAASALSRSGGHSMAQKAVMLAPWKLQPWLALAYIRSLGESG
ncbi:TPR-like protein [Pleurotus eryngii]|uniref:TPR-like protein n=1 Tax=Pleurotus eryngii TaxID=5323 RepID=A0A9P6A198_PLEER|nr:TPR-like protein [Pleurotus eryngii]